MRASSRARAALLRTSRNTVRILFGVAALGLYGLTVFLFPSQFQFPGWPEMLLTVIVTAFMINFSIPMQANEGSLVPLVSLAAVLAYSPLPIVLAVALGVFLGNVMRNTWRDGPSYRDLRRGEQIALTVFDLARHISTLIISVLGYLISGGVHPFT